MNPLARVAKNEEKMKKISFIMFFFHQLFGRVSTGWASEKQQRNK
jgi:hypothetical protein